MLRIPVLVRSGLVALTLAVTACAGEAPKPGPAQVVDLLSDVQPQDQPEDRDGDNQEGGELPYCDESGTEGDENRDGSENAEGEPCQPRGGCDERGDCDTRPACEDGAENCDSDGGEDGQPGTPYCGCELILEMCPGFGERCEGGECVRVCDTANEICVECNAGGECRACQGAECAEFSCGDWYEACQARCIEVYGGSAGSTSDEGSATCEGGDGCEDGQP